MYYLLLIICIFSRLILDLEMYKCILGEEISILGIKKRGVPYFDIPVSNL